MNKQQEFGLWERSRRMGFPMPENQQLKQGELGEMIGRLTRGKPYDKSIVSTVELGKRSLEEMFLTEAGFFIGLAWVFGVEPVEVFKMAGMLEKPGNLNELMEQFNDAVEERAARRERHKEHLIAY